MKWKTLLSARRLTIVEAGDRSSFWVHRVISCARSLTGLSADTREQKCQAQVTMIQCLVRIGWSPTMKLAFHFNHSPCRRGECVNILASLVAVVVGVGMSLLYSQLTTPGVVSAQAAGPCSVPKGLGAFRGGTALGNGAPSLTFEATDGTISIVQLGVCRVVATITRSQ